jgi:hypothetical protein
VSVGNRVEGKTAAVAEVRLISVDCDCGGGSCGSGALTCACGGVTLACGVGRSGEGCLCGTLVPLRVGTAAATNRRIPKDTMKIEPVAAPAIIRSTAKNRRARFI